MSKSNAAVQEFAPYFRSDQRGFDDRSGVMVDIFQLRYQVYCTECGFLDPEQYPDRQERDDFDEDSAHFCAYNRNDELVGYVRLVPATGEEGRFPWESHGLNLSAGVTLPPRALSAEISRLMVRRDYRRRRGDTMQGVSTVDEHMPIAGDRRVEAPQIVLSLYRQMYQHSLRAGLRYWFAAMERPLARSLAQMGFGFEQIGAEADYFGPVAPYIGDLRELERRLEQRSPQLLAWMQRPEVTHS